MCSLLCRKVPLCHSVKSVQVNILFKVTFAPCYDKEQGEITKS